MYKLLKLTILADAKHRAASLRQQSFLSRLLSAWCGRLLMVMCFARWCDTLLDVPRLVHDAAVLRDSQMDHLSRANLHQQPWRKSSWDEFVQLNYIGEIYSENGKQPRCWVAGCSCAVSHNYRFSFRSHRLSNATYLLLCLIVSFAVVVYVSLTKRLNKWSVECHLSLYPLTDKPQEAKKIASEVGCMKIWRHLVQIHNLSRLCETSIELHVGKI